MLKILALALISLSCFAADCDIVFTLTASNLTTAPFNNKGKACVNWQLSYFSSGFTALTLTLQSAPDAGTTPGTFVTFAGTVLSGTNPMTSTAQGTATFGGTAYPWMRVVLSGQMGTGQITGRLLGIQLTSAASVNFGGSSTFDLYPRPTAPVSSSFSWLTTQGTATETQVNQALVLFSGAPVAGTAIRMRGLTIAGTTLTAALNCTMEITVGRLCGIALRDSGTGRLVTWGMDHRANTAQIIGSQWTDPNTFVGDYAVAQTPAGLPKVVWLRIVITGAQTSTLWHSEDGTNFVQAVSVGGGFFTPDQWGYIASAGGGVGNSGSYSTLHSFLVQ